MRSDSPTADPAPGRLRPGVGRGPHPHSHPVPRLYRSVLRADGRGDRGPLVARAQPEPGPRCRPDTWLIARSVEGQYSRARASAIPGSRRNTVARVRPCARSGTFGLGSSARQRAAGGVRALHAGTPRERRRSDAADALSASAGRTAAGARSAAVDASSGPRSDCSAPPRPIEPIGPIGRIERGGHRSVGSATAASIHHWPARAGVAASVAGGPADAAVGPSRCSVPGTRVWRRGRVWRAPPSEPRRSSRGREPGGRDRHRRGPAPRPARRPPRAAPAQGETDHVRVDHPRRRVTSSPHERVHHYCIR